MGTATTNYKLLASFGTLSFKIEYNTVAFRDMIGANSDRARFFLSRAVKRGASNSGPGDRGDHAAQPATTPNYQLLDGGKLAIPPNDIEKFFSILFYYNARWSPSPLPSKVNLTPWFVIETPRAASSGNDDDDGGDNDEIAKTRLFIDYDVELEITDQNNLSIETFDREFFDQAIDKVCLSLAKTSKELFRNSGDGYDNYDNDDTIVVIRDSTSVRKKQRGTQQFLKVGVHLVFPNLIFRVGSPELWTAYVMLYQKAVFRIFGINGPMFQKGSVYARETEFDLAVVTRSDVKLRMPYNYKKRPCCYQRSCGVCRGRGGVTDGEAGFYRPTRRVCFDESDGFMVRDMKSRYQALEDVSSHTELNDYYNEFRLAMITPPYFRVGDSGRWRTHGLTTLLVDQSMIVSFPTCKSERFLRDSNTTGPDGRCVKKRKRTLRSNETYQRLQRQEYDTENRDVILELEKLIMTNVFMTITTDEKLLAGLTNRRIADAAGQTTIRLHPFLARDNTPLLRLCQPTYFFKDTESYVRTVTNYLLQSKKFRDCSLPSSMHKPPSELLMKKIFSCYKDNVEKMTRLCFRSFTKKCPFKYKRVINSLFNEELPKYDPADARTETKKSITPLTPFIQIAIVSAAKKLNRKNKRGGNNKNISIQLFIDESRNAFKELAKKKKKNGDVAVNAGAVLEEEKLYNNLRHRSNTLKCEVKPLLEMRAVRPQEWVVVDEEAQKKQQPILKIVGATITVSCWSTGCTVESCAYCPNPISSPSPPQIRKKADVGDVFNVTFDDAATVDALFNNHSSSPSNATSRRRSPASSASIQPSEALRVGPAKFYALLHADLKEVIALNRRRNNFKHSTWS